MDKIRRQDCLLSIGEIKPNARNAHTHSKSQVRQIAESIRALGFGAPVLVDENFTLIAGEGRWKAAELLNLGKIPAVQLLGLSEAQKRALALPITRLLTMPDGTANGWRSNCRSLPNSSSKKI